MPRSLKFPEPVILKDGRVLVAEEGMEAPNSRAAINRAAALAKSKAGVIAFSRSGDPSLGEFEDAVILARYGDTPSDLAGFTSV